MKLSSQIIALLQKDLKLELRNKQGIASLLLFVFSTVFVIYMAFIHVKPTTWVILYWIILLFAAINGISRSYQLEAGDQQLYFYQIADPKALLFSKVIFNFLLLFLLSIITIAGFSLLFGFPFANPYLFILAMLQGSLALSIAFSILGAIAAIAGNAHGLLPILGFPVVIPIIGLLIGISVDAINGEAGINFWKHNQILMAIDFLMLALGWILFPYLWQE